MKFLLCSVLLVAIVATGLAKPMSKDIDETADSQEQYAKYAAMTPDELDEELAKLHRQLDENEAALQEYEAQERKHNERMKHQKAMEEKLSKYQPSDDDDSKPVDEEDSYMEEQNSQFKSDEVPMEQDESEKEPDVPEKQEQETDKEPQPDKDQGYMYEEPDVPEKQEETDKEPQPEKDQGYMYEEPDAPEKQEETKKEPQPEKDEGYMYEEPLSEDRMEPSKGKQNNDAIEEEYMVPQEKEEDPQAFAKRVNEWDQVESLDHEDEDVNVENEFDQ